MKAHQLAWFGVVLAFLIVVGLAAEYVLAQPPLVSGIGIPMGDKAERGESGEMAGAE